MKKLVIAFLLLPVLSACSDFAPPASAAVPTVASTAAPIPTASLMPTKLVVPPAETPDIASTLAPEGQPVSEWNGIPIMPGASAGEGDEDGYVFTVKATPEQIQQYYQLELGKLGWEPLAQGDGDSSMLIFTNKAAETITVSIIAKGDEALVLLVK